MGKWSKQELESIATRYDRMLKLSSYPVAVKLFKSLEELEAVKDEKGRPVPQVKGRRLTVCQLLAQARYLGRLIAGTKENLSGCIPGSAAMGFRELPEDYADGYVRAYFTDEAIARKTMGTVPRFEAGAYVAMLVAPLERMTIDPDLVIFYGNTAQMQRFVQAYLYNKGGRLEFSSCGEAVCADMVVLPVKTGKPAFGLPCNGARILAWPSDNELACGVPADILEDVLEGLEFTHAGMVRYPITWQHIDWEPPPGSPLRNVMEGKGFFPPEMRHPERKA